MYTGIPPRQACLWGVEPARPEQPEAARVEDRLEDYLDYYVKAVDQHRWYGFWNYGDFMHTYDSVRHTWRC